MASSRRSITTVMRAETGQYVTAMDSAAKATTRVGDAAKSAEKQSSGLGSLGSKIGDGITTSSQKAKGGLDQMLQSARDNRQAWEGIGTTLTVAGGAVTAFGIAALNTGIQYNTLQQTSRAALESLLGSAQAANAQMDKLDEFASSSPFAKDVFIKAQQQMLAFGIEAQKVVPYLDSIQNAVAAAGGSNQDIAEISTIFSKIQSSAKITAQDLQELGNRGVNAAELIGSQMGMTGAQVRESITNGTLDAQQALDALAAGMSDRFGGAAANVKNTFAGAMDRVKAAWRDFSSELAAPLVDPEGGGALVSMLNGLADAMRGFEGLPDPLKDTVTQLGALGAVGATAAGGIFLLAPKVADLVSDFNSWRKSAPVVSGALGDMGKAVGGVMAVVTAFQLLDAATREAAPSVSEIENRLLSIQNEGKSTGSLLKGVATDWDPTGLSPLKEPKTKQDWQDLLTYLDKTSSGLGGLQNTVGGWLGLNDDVENTKEALENTGTALGEMASTDLGGAQQQFKQFADAAGGGEEVVRKLLKWMPGYREALVEQANAAGMATDETTLLKLATGELAIEGDKAVAATNQVRSAQEVLAAALESTNPSIATQAGAYQELIDGVGKAGDAFLDLSDDLGKSEFSLDGWLKKLENQAEAAQKWADNIQKLAERGASADLLQGLIEQGPNAAQAVDALANGTEEDMKRAEKAIGGAADATGELQDRLSKEAVLKINTDAAKQQGKSTEEYISGLQAAIEINGDSVPAKKEGEGAKAYIDRLLAVLGIDGNGVPAQKEAEGTSAFIKRLKQTMRINGYAIPARKEGESAQHYIDRLRAVLTADANGAPARREGEQTKAYINRLKGIIEADGNSAPARRDSESTTAYIDRLKGTITVNANTSQAQSGIQTVAGLLAGLRDKTITVTTYNRNVFSTTGKPAGSKGTPGYGVFKAAGGSVRGPGGPKDDKVPIMASDGEHVLTAEDVNAMGGQQAVYDWRRSLHSSKSEPEAYRSGGAVRSAEKAVRNATKRRNAAQSALRKARRSKVTGKGKARERSEDRKQKRVDAAQKAYDKRAQTLRDQRDRLSRLREERREQSIGIRRGEQREQATSGLSGAYGLVDEMYSVARSGDLTKGQSSRLQTRAYKTEKSMRKLYKDAAGVERSLDKATKRMERMQQISDSVADTITGGFKLGEVTSPWTGGAATSGKEYLTSAKSYAAKTKAFAGKLKRLQKAGFSGVILQEVAAMGVEEGTVAADALLQLNPKDTKALNQAYKDMSKYADQAGQYVSAGFYKGGLAAAEGLVSGLKKDQKKIEKQINNMATSMIKALKKALGIKSPSKEFAQIGLQTGEGMVVGLKASAGDVARASEDLARIPSAVIPAAYANPPKAANSRVTAVVDKGAMADAMNGAHMTLLVNGKQMDAVVQTTVDRNLNQVAATLGGGRR